MNNQVIDCFSFAGEKEILDIRLNELDSVVSKFLIIESNRTQTGLKKPYYFEELKGYFKNFLNKIIYVKLDDSGVNQHDIKSGDWSQEFRVRRSIKNEGFYELKKYIKLSNNDVFIISDVDEIPKRECVGSFVDSGDGLRVINHYFNCYFLNWYSEFRSWGWHGSIFLRYYLLNASGFDIQWYRNEKDRLTRTGNQGEGWHFSGVGHPLFETNFNKWITRIEPHDKTCLLNKEGLRQQFNDCVLRDKNFFFCDSPTKREIPMKILPDDKLPEYVRNNKEKFKNLLYEQQ